MDWMDKLLYPLQWVVAWILAIFHEIFTAIGARHHSLIYISFACCE